MNWCMQKGTSAIWKFHTLKVPVCMHQSYFHQKCFNMRRMFTCYEMIVNKGVYCTWKKAWTRRGLIWVINSTELFTFE